MKRMKTLTRRRAPVKIKVKSKDDRRTQFSVKERSVLYEALREYWNDIPDRFTVKRATVMNLIDEFGQE